MTLKEIIITEEGHTNVIYIAVVPGKNNETNQEGFLVYHYKANIPKPSDLTGATRLLEHLFETESDAIKQGEKIVKKKIKDFYKAAKKEANERRKATQNISRANTKKTRNKKR